ncbi:DUF981 domain-containing protein [Nocardioides dubius]|uniref:DUF981 domain-containing protein n=1 Tax=Nocardioides dubius TaxID=317019 RepID=A0ABN1TPE0_9ACTN
MLTAQALKIDWASMPTYNTIMAVAAGVGLLSLVLFVRDVARNGEEASAEGWALNFGVLGAILASTGLHMTLTWPLAAGGFPFDNIIFGETSLGFGVLLLAASLYLWKRGTEALTGTEVLPRLAKIARPVSTFVGFLGGALIAIAVAGIKYELFAAPAEEPISGEFAEWPLVEAIFMSGLLGLVGVGAIAFPFAVRSVLRGDSLRSLATQVVGWAWAITGVVFALFGVMNFFTHIGLIVNTM